MDAGVKYQTIEGFGADEHDVYPPSSFFPAIFDDLGVSIFRFTMGSMPEPTNDNSDPFVINWNGVSQVFDYSGIHGGGPLLPPLLQEAQRRKVKLIGVVYSPPVWMKTGGVLNGGSLSPGYENEFAEFIVIWLKGIEKYYGVHVDYVSLQNEPNYINSTYASCQYTPSQLRDLVKLVGARLVSEGITSRIVAPDVSNLVAFNNGWADSVGQDSTALGYIDRLITHTYNQDYWNPDGSIPDWQAASNLANRYNKRLWMTEYCNDGPNQGTLQEALPAAVHIHNALVYGNVTAYVIYELYQWPAPLLKSDGTRTPRFYTIKQYYRYVRPGAVRIKAQSDDANLLSTAFVQPSDGTFTTVVINRSGVSKNAAFVLNNNTGISRLNVIRTSASENAASVGQVTVSNNSFTYTLPPSSVTTFTGGLKPAAPTGLVIK